MLSVFFGNSDAVRCLSVRLVNIGKIRCCLLVRYDPVLKFRQTLPGVWMFLPPCQIGVRAYEEDIPVLCVQFVTELLLKIQINVRIFHTCKCICSLGENE